MTPDDLAAHAALGITSDMLERAHVRRVDDREARNLLNQRRPGDLAGIVYPYSDPRTGQQVTYRVRRDHPEIENGNPKNKYLSAVGDRSHIYFAPGVVALLADTTVRVVLMEAEKSVLSVTCAAEQVHQRVLAIGLGGCYGWRGRRGKLIDAKGRRVDEMGPLADLDLVTWIDRDVLIVFDSNAATNHKVQRARRALAQTLAQRGATVRIADLPIEDGINGPDDYVGRHGASAFFALLHKANVPEDSTPEAMFSDARLAETIADDVLSDRYVWCKGLGWLYWSGSHWMGVTEEHVREAVRRYVLRRFSEAAKRMCKAEIDGWYTMLSAARLSNVLGLTRGIVERTADEFDAHPDLLNTPQGVVDLRTAQVRPHDPDLLLTKITRGSYRAGWTHPDWDQGLSALPADIRDWMQVRIGQAITGHPTPDGIIPICQGGGENGKSCVLTDGILPACGDYAAPASPKLIADKGEHSTERADLRGQRFLIAEELTEDRALNVTALKQIADVSTIKARYVHRDNITFRASHSLFVTTNYVPLVNETDHGTWRRLLLVVFPFTFRKPGDQLTGPDDRHGDPRLKERLRNGKDGQHDAVVTWVVEGARRWYADGFPRPPAAVQKQTRGWRREADRILGFWDECLAGEPHSCVLTTDLLVAFNSWLRANGHKEWTKELFASRFRPHHETVRHRITEHRPRNLDKLRVSRPPGSAPTLPDRPYVYVGLRFRHPGEPLDNAEDTAQWSERSDPSTKCSIDRTSGRFVEGSDQSDRDPVEGHDDGLF